MLVIIDIKHLVVVDDDKITTFMRVQVKVENIVDEVENVLDDMKNLNVVKVDIVVVDLN